MNEYLCPLCQSPLATQLGSQIDPLDGVTLWCPSSTCPSQEVMGHASNTKGAFEIIRSKYFPS